MIIFHPMMFILAQYRPMSLVTLFTMTARRNTWSVSPLSSLLTADWSECLRFSPTLDTQVVPLFLVIFLIGRYYIATLHSYTALVRLHCFTVSTLLLLY